MDTIIRIRLVGAALLLAAAVGACAIQLRSGEDEAAAPTSTSQETDPLASKLAQCRTVNYEQRDDFIECRKIWAEKRRQFLSQRKEAVRQSGDGASSSGSIVKDESRLPSGYPFPRTPGGNER
ncbi:putative entry exclusion protein TrbK-alt [Bradyrhizobium sp. CB82]|uniref:putative entry exclusion protein TrbK-alt n=1 Tax=Bradyrhizobium sp. CB82 TaxID=3039159 RepID=UPI0024B1096D|nr:putative entry exclusion protein TrbK-alt [Bradyrhizobium sp. CB82]WFU45030.1 putative entry exclusion protein TrbK-alt [Bradyrhizobium sp. CB82]